MGNTLHIKPDSPMPNFIIAGTAKAASTSMFRYLCDHPDVCGSSVKESAFFEKEYTGNKESDLANYLSYFQHCSSDAKILFEASVGYLSYGKTVAERIFSFSPDMKLLFILRNPADRLYSYFRYIIALMEIAKDSDFDDYVLKCMDYASGEKPASIIGIKEKHLTYYASGRYSFLINEYLEYFNPDSIKIMFYENLKADTRAFMEELCEFLDINSEFYSNYDFPKINITFSGNILFLHRFALFANKKLERYLRSRPYLKDPIAKAYKRLNLQRKGPPDMSESTRAMLNEYYRPSIEALAEMLTDKQNAPGWVNVKRSV